MMNAAVYLLLPLVLLVGWLYLMQPRMVFFPVRDVPVTPADWNMAYEDVWLETEDGIRLHGWYLPAANADRVLLFLHGNAGNIAHRGDSLGIFHRLGLNVLIIDYRGYGNSGGSPTEQGLYRDAEAAWRWLTQQRGFAPRQVVLFGRSLGGSVAAQLASGTSPGGLILESTFSSAREFARQAFPLLSWLMIPRYRFDAAAAVRSVDCPILVLHSAQDEIIPVSLGRRLYDAAKAPKTFVELRGDHNGGFLLSQPEYEQALGGFLDTLPR